MEQRGELFDYILLETTGLADPGNLAPLFWVDEGLGSTIYLDGIVTLVDAANLLKGLDEPVDAELAAENEDEHDHKHAHVGPRLTTAHLQISHADVVVINKADRVSADELAAVQERVRAINSLAKVHVTQHGRIPQLEGFILDLHAYDQVTAESLDFASKGYSHLDPSISTVTLSLPVLEAAQLGGLDAWLRSVLWENRLPGSEERGVWEIHRIKGRLPLVSGQVMLLQGVREVFELLDGAEDVTDGESEAGGAAKIVVIGRGLGGQVGVKLLQDSLLAAVQSQ